MTPIRLPDGYFLSPLTAADKPAMVKYLNEREIYLRTFYIPYPYKLTDADFWIDHMAAVEKKNRGQATTFAIRGPGGEMIGSVGLDGLTIGKDHRAEIGYWLAKPFWNQGIVTKAVSEVVKLGFETLGLQKITSSIFSFNSASQRVLEKNGFTLEGELIRHFKKEGDLLDAKVYAKFK